ncbi:MAG: transcriptional repressor NrdR [Polyangiaceae bacterium]|nr:transcriptional repressor NrdR [Polyangiaceae bacterium]
MRCPACGNEDDRVIDSRTSERGECTRRRRECTACGRRFTTYERVELVASQVAKKDGRREPYDREKLLGGVRVACKKRPVSVAQIDELASRIEAEVAELGDKEIDSRFLGERVMAHLRALDEVAYVRFASVYREFRSISAFREELGKLGDQS